jgi:ribonuclease BN (tRNA processing enzyme)
MRVTFFGTRGSLPVPGPQTVRYGGNTSCVAVRSAGGTLIVLDMGTGAYALGRELAASGHSVRGHVLISHTHWDHIQGLPFFAPLFRPGNEWDIYAPRGLGPSLREALSGQMQYTYFPLELEQLGATIRYHDLVEGSLTLGDIAVETHYLNHSALTLGYRLTADGVTTVYALDHEPFATSLAAGNGPLTGGDRRHVEFLAGADLLIHDAQYLAEEYGLKAGWGHSTVEYALRVARAAGVRRLALAHHDPERSDDALDALVARARTQAASLDLFAAAEGMSIDLAPGETASSRPPGHVGGRGSGTRAVAGPALAGQSVLVTGRDTARIGRLVGVLQSDGIPVSACDLTTVSDRVERNRPALLVIADTSDMRETAERVRAVRNLDTLGNPLPIILVTLSEDGLLNEGLGITDQLVEPFTANYARTRLRAWLMRRACLWALPPEPAGEPQRLAALQALGILDTPPDEHLDRLVRLAADLFDVPIAAVTLVDRDRQWFKASCGLPARETPRDESFCAHIVAQPATMIVPDALLDPRFAENPGVVGAPHLRFYAGHPLVLAGGHCVGTFCIADVSPRQLDAKGAAYLAFLAELALRAIEPAAART